MWRNTVKDHNMGTERIVLRVQQVWPAGVLLGSPGDHLLLFVGGVPPAAQHLGRRGQEVETVVLEVLVYQGQEDLVRRRADQVQ